MVSQYFNMVAIAYDHSRIPLSVLVHITSGSKDGMMQIVWPSIFRGIEQPDEFHPSNALRKLMEKFAKEHPQPFEELKRLAEDHHLPYDVMDFLEKPLYGTLNGMANSKREPLESLDTKMENWDTLYRLQHDDKSRGGVLDQIGRELLHYWKDKEETLPFERDLTEDYRTWLAKRLGSKVAGAVGGWGNMGDSLTTKEIAGLRHHEKIPFICMVGYDTRKDFDMKGHNRDAFLAVYEGVADTWQKGHIVLIAYGRKIQTVKTMDEARALADKLKFFDGEYLAAPLTRDTFVELAGRSK